ncbi:MAG TPA: PD-(D/E)XK nuclease family protein [Vicinamibacterales bacterium]|nr:PD-(D/E)XK nuclease family protein [Vicinamibacterales bacterium]
MITPRRTRLVRVADPHAFRQAIVQLCADAADAPAAPLVVVPTRGAGHQLRQTLQHAQQNAVAEAVTREQLYDRLHARLPQPPRRLTSFDRDVIAQAAARHAASSTPDLPFRLRPGLVAEILRFYDLLRRQSQHVQRFEELIEQQLAGHMGTDPGADRMLQQTQFLAETFREYERRARGTGAVDEHMLRERLVADPSPRPAVHIVVAVPDWIADPDGLYVADFDLLTRLPGLAVIDVVTTEATLESGFHERLHTWLPGLEEVAAPRGQARVRPTLITPPDPAGPIWFTYRDREEELIAIARRIRQERTEATAEAEALDVRTASPPKGQFAGQAHATRPPALDRIAVVFKRPLPYLYLADDTLAAAGIPYQISDALPLAAEPTAAALDLAIDLVASAFSRSAIVALLRSPHFTFAASRAETSALDHALSDQRYLGELSRLEALAVPKRAEAAHAAAVAVARELSPLLDARPASQQLSTLVAFFDGHIRPLAADDPYGPRERRARTAILETLAYGAAAYAAHDDPSWTIDDVAAAVRRWIEAETFAPESAPRGVHLLDDQAARFGDFESMTIVGVIEGDWPERARRNIFYPSNLMKALGWPSEKDRRAAADARFLDLLASSSREVAVSVVTLDDEALVEPSSVLDEIPRARLSTDRRPAAAASRVFLDEALTLDPVDPGALRGDAREWGEMRPARSPRGEARFHGDLPPLPPRAWSVSALETYLGCPFKFFAQHLLHLEEDPDDEEVMDPRRQGQFVHKVFEEFFRTWQAKGGGAITPANLDAANALFTSEVDRLIDRLPAAEAGLERTRLLGSPAAAGLGDAVLRMEAERPVAVVERLLEHRLTGEFAIETAGGTRTVALKGKADRVDLLADGTFRLIDYKLGWPPQRGRALQLPIYSLCAEQELARTRGRRWSVGEAVYLAFKGPRRVVPLFTNATERADVLTKAQQRLADTLDAIERGEFPPTPDDVHRCETCSFAAVCRKDYVGDV